MKKTSIKTRIMSIVAAAVMACSTAAVSMATASAATADASVATANYTNKFIQVYVSDEWLQDGARVAAYFYNEANNQKEWKNLTQYRPGSKTQGVTVPGDYTHVIFVRLPKDAGNSFDQAWNKTSDLRISDLGNTYSIQGWELESGAVSEKKNEAKTVATNMNKFIQVYVSDEWLQDGARVAAYFYNEANNQKEWKNLTQYRPGSKTQGVTVPGDYTHVIFVRLPKDAGNSFDQAWNKTSDLRISDLGKHLQHSGLGARR